MRELDPFSFFINHASAIGGLGGDSMSPDPRYCFHTPYVPVRPGPAAYELQLNGVRASRGELTLRIHALRRDTGENASLVAGGRLSVGVDQVQDLSVKVHFGALRNVEYAFYGYFIEDSDIHADGLKTILHEHEGEDAVFIEPPRSILTLDEVRSEVRPANALKHVKPVDLTVPVSQDMTLAQLELLDSDGATSQNWAEALCLNALKAYGVHFSALEGLLVGKCSTALRNELAAKGFSLMEAADYPLPLPDSSVFCDFLLWPTGLDLQADGSQRWDAIKAWLARLKFGGIGVLTCRYDPGLGPTRAHLAVDGARVSSNEIGKWALRLIAEGYAVAPLAFSSYEDLQLDEHGLAHFAMIVQRQSPRF